MRILICTWAVGLCCLLLCCTENTKPSRTFPEEILHEGDLAFRKGDGLASNVILHVDKHGVYSHTGIVVRNDNKWKVVHAVLGEPDFDGDRDRVKMDDISTFFGTDRALTGAIVRIDNDSAAGKAAMSALAIYRQGKLFDHDYDLDDTTKMYCTEFIHHVFMLSGIDLTEGRRSIVSTGKTDVLYILPSDIQESKDLKEIYSF